MSTNVLNGVFNYFHRNLGLQVPQMNSHIKVCVYAVI